MGARENLPALSAGGRERAEHNKAAEKRDESGGNCNVPAKKEILGGESGETGRGGRRSAARGRRLAFGAWQNGAPPEGRSVRGPYAAEGCVGRNRSRGERGRARGDRGAGKHDKGSLKGWRMGSAGVKKSPAGSLRRRDAICSSTGRSTLLRRKSAPPVGRGAQLVKKDF